MAPDPSESLALSTNSEFMAIIEEARWEIASGETMCLAAMKRAGVGAAPRPGRLTGRSWRKVATSEVIAAACGSSSSFARLSQCLLREPRVEAESSCLKSFEERAKCRDQPFTPGFREQTQDPSALQACLYGDPACVRLVDQDEGAREFLSQGDGFSFAQVDRTQQGVHTLPTLNSSPLDEGALERGDFLRARPPPPLDNDLLPDGFRDIDTVE